ncbi:MAG: hypothetical protein ACJ76J_02730 [Thermoanaerobaculia bacterium]
MTHSVSPEEDRFSALAARVEELTRSVEALQGRLSILEQGGSTARAASPAPMPVLQAVELHSDEVDQEALPSSADVARILGLVGRTLIIFGGAFLLRAVTASGYLPQGAGVAAAFVYALFWLYLADRTAGRRAAPSAALSAAFHGATAVLIGLPLIWETTTRFQYLGPTASGAVLSLFVAAAAFVAWRRGLQSLAWLVGLGTPVAALFLLSGTKEAAPFSFALVLLGVVGLALYELRGWSGVGWWMGLMGPFGAFLAVFTALAQKRGGEPAALAIGLLLALACLAGLVLATLVAKREVRLFDAVQSGLAVLSGYGGAAFAARALGGGAAALVGGLGLLLAVAGYWAAFRLIARAQRRKLLLYSTLGLVFALAGSALLLPAPARAVAWSAAAGLAGWQSVRRSRVTLSLHGAVYSLAAAGASGLLTAAVYAFAAPAGTPWPPLAPVAFLALAAAAAVCALPVPHPAPFWKPYEGLTRVLQIAVFLWGAAGVGLHLLAPLLARVAEPVDAGLLATVRTAVLTAVALLLGWAARWPRFREAGWLVYPTLLLAAVKLLAEDFPQGRPATLFVALALCGLAFIFAPRMARRGA